MASNHRADSDQTAGLPTSFFSHFFFLVKKKWERSSFPKGKIYKSPVCRQIKAFAKTLFAKAPSADKKFPFGKGRTNVLFLCLKEKERKRSKPACRWTAVEYGGYGNQSPVDSARKPSASLGTIRLPKPAERFRTPLGSLSSRVLAIALRYAQGASSGLGRFPPSYLAPNGLLRL